MAVVVGCLLGCSCAVDKGPSPHDFGPQLDLTFLDGLMLANEAITVVPDQYWSPREAVGGWSFRNSASLLVRVHREENQELRLVLTPNRATSRFHFAVSWDGDPIPGSPGCPEITGTVIRISPEQLSAGDHELTITRRYQLDDPRDHGSHDNTFTRIQWGMREDLQTLDPTRAERLRLTAQFLAHGLTGGSELRLAGCLAEGSQKVSAGLHVDRDGSLSLLVENVSRREALFTVRVGSTSAAITVPNGGRQPLDVSVPAGTHRLELAVDGDPEGLFLWGAPYLRPAPPGLSGPVVLVTMDTTRRDVVTPYAAEALVTPNIGKFASRATVYQAAFASSPWTLPSHASMFTGLYPSRHGAGVTFDRVPSEIATVAERLHQQGFATAGFAGGEMCASRWGVAQGFGQYRDPEGFETVGNRLTDAALEFIRRHRSDPFFLFINYFDPHALYEAPAEFQKRFGVEELREKVGKRGTWGEFAGGSNAAWRAIISGEAEPTPAAIEFINGAYRAEVAFMDHEIGRLLAALHDYGLYDDALIVLVSDHGELLGEGGFFSHCCRLDPVLVEVPLLIKFPGQRQGRTVGDAVSHVDLYPTLLGVPHEPGMDGFPLGEADFAVPGDRRRVFYEEHESRIHPLFANMMISSHVFGIQRLHARRIVWDGGAECAAGRVGAWREETCSKPWADQLAEVLEILGRSRADDVTTPAGVLSEEERERLEALGYVR